MRLLLAIFPAPTPHLRSIVAFEGCSSRNLVLADWI